MRGIILNTLINLFSENHENNLNSIDILKCAPTAEEICISIDFNYWNFLLYLFPNTFKNDKEAYDFFEYFCKKAKDSDENENVYKWYDLFKKTWDINYKIDMISGLVTIANSYDNNYSGNLHFNLFNIEDIKNNELKQEIINIYENNFEHLKQLGIVTRLSNGNIFAFTHFVININGIYKNTHWAPDFCNDTFLWDNDSKNHFALPIEDNIIFLRKLETNKNSISLNEKKKYIDSLVQKYTEYKLEYYNDDNNNTIHLQNDMFDAFISTRYFYPSDNIEFTHEEPKLPYKYIDLSRV